MTENRDAGASVRQFTAELVGAAMDGDYEDVADALGLLARAGSNRISGEIVAELAGRCASVVRARQPADPGAVFTVAVTDERARPVEVDRLPPGPLAALRALLADLGGDAESRDIQLELAARGEPDDVIGVVIHQLVWLVELSGSSAPTLPPLSCFAQ
ncbi:hypothetical protein SAMN05421837_102350 [Amycolatopsis pretoriensis]|uniref:Uncharacterized protein n=1 Tax=Amycolatopsis pretoriensis TaxID=218821 RepID=A0A1H5QC40_9PSEU|nr:hypothetical protein [Amycolatopsis pretoriensis]SEF23682.1 hypothetical protein SAMN05421837_102350 [Amycolatopsis pretoriensis]